jgi:hypothetical protein
MQITQIIVYTILRKVTNVSAASYWAVRALNLDSDTE